MKICNRESATLTFDALQIEEIMSQKPELTIELTNTIKIKPTADKRSVESITIDLGAVRVSPRD